MVLPEVPRPPMMIDRSFRLLVRLLVFTAISTAVSGTHAAIAPYLQTPTSTSIHVCWQSASLTSAVVRYGTGTPDQTATGESDQLSNGVVWHDVKLTGLVPGRAYSYRCIQGAESSAVFTFATPPPPSVKSGHIRFAIISDSQEYAAQSSMVVDSMRAMVTRLWGDDLSASLGLVIHSGDILSSGNVLAQYQSQYFGSMAPVSGNVPFMVSIGNHEGESEYYYRYMRYGEFGGPAGDRYYSFRYGRLQFIALNTNGRYRDDTQIAWLDSVCAAAENDDQIDWIFTYGHHPALSETWPDGNTTYTETRILPTISKYSKATLHAAGHTHAYERGALKDASVHTLIFGGAGGALDRWRGYQNQTDYPLISRSHDHHGYALIDVDLAARSYIFRAFSLGSQDVSGPGLSLPNVEIDTYTAWKRKARPERPVAGALPDSIDLPVALTGSAYVASRPQWSSAFQVRTAAGTYVAGAGLVADVHRDAENVYWDTGAPYFTPIDRNAGIDLTRCVLTASPSMPPGRYYWRVRYRDVNLDWSDWSAERTFVVRDPSVSASTSDRALRFDGGSSYLEVASSLDSAVLPVRGMTVETWVRPEAMPVYGGFIGACEDNSGTQKGWVLGNVLNHLSFGLATSGANDGNGLMTYLQDPAIAVAGRWYHVAAVYDGAEMRLVVNGTQVAVSNAQSGDILYDQASRFTLGAYHDANEFTPFTGTLDEVRLWQKALTLDEIRRWMFRKMSVAHPSSASLISCWNFDQAIGSTINDMMGNNPATNRGLGISAGVRSTAPVGDEGSFFITQTPGFVGAPGAGVQFNPVSTMSASNNLGIYTTGSPAGPAVAADILPNGVSARAHLSWGFWEQGIVTGSAGLRYGSMMRAGQDAALRLLFRVTADTAWADVTEDHYQDIPNSQFIVSGPISSGLYTIGWSAVTSADAGGFGEIPPMVILEPNYPNPFNPSTTITFSLSSDADVRLVVHDVLGRELAVLAHGQLSAGQHRVEWIPGIPQRVSIASGVYFCRLSAHLVSGERHILHRKMLFVR